MRTFYLCDGNIENCSKNECYKFGGECCHTENMENAKNSPEKRRFIKNAMGDDWEIEN